MIVRKTLSALIALVCAPMTADGLPIKDGHYFAGPSLVLELTSNQKLLIPTTGENDIALKLTNAQRRKILRESKIRIAPTKIYVALPEFWSSNCTCLSSNIAIFFCEGYIQLPMSFIRPDREAKLYGSTN
jgi:hypothetical protein